MVGIGPSSHGSFTTPPPPSSQGLLAFPAVADISQGNPLLLLHHRIYFQNKNVWIGSCVHRNTRRPHDLIWVKLFKTYHLVHRLSHQGRVLCSAGCSEDAVQYDWKLDGAINWECFITCIIPNSTIPCPFLSLRSIISFWELDGRRLDGLRSVLQHPGPEGMLMRYNNNSARANPGIPPPSKWNLVMIQHTRGLSFPRRKI